MARVGSGTIRTGSAESFDVVLTAGKPHRILVQPDDPTVDFDLLIYDENGNRVVEDVSTSADAFCIVTPRWTGKFRLVVTSAQGASSYTIVVED
jgi:hypothetical protein